MNLYYFLFLFAIANIILGRIIFLRRKGKNYNVYYSLVLYAIAGWSFSLGMFFKTTDTAEMRMWTNILYTSASLIADFFLLFSFVFHTTYKVKLGKILLLLEPTILIAYLLFFTDTIIFDIIPISRIKIFGSLYLVFAGHFFVYMIWAFINLIRIRKKSAGVAVVQANYVIYGTLITAILGTVADIILPAWFNNFTFAPFGPFFTLIMVVSFGYAIFKYDFRWTYLKNWNKLSGFF